MLIKRKNLETYLGSTEAPATRGNGATLVEVPSAADLEIQRAKQEATLIKKEAEGIIKKAENKLKQAEDEANEIINSATEEAEIIKEKAFKDTLKKANVEAEKIKNQARVLLKKLFEVKREALHEAHTQIIDIALDLTEKIIKYQVTVDTNVLKTQVIEAIKKATTDADRIQVFVNPQDLSTLQKSTNDIKQLFPIGIDIVALTNDEVDRGSCLIETKSGQLDARFSTQLKALKELASHLEVKEPNIPLETDLKIKTEIEAKIETVIEREIKEEPEKEQETWINDEALAEEENLFSPTEEDVKQEAVGEAPLIEFPGEEETFPFSKESQNVEEEEPIEIPEEVVKEIKKEPKIQWPQEQSPSGKKKLTINIEAGSEEDDDEPYEDEEEKAPESGSILKKKSNDIKKIANEVEDDPDWKSQLKDED